MKKEKVLIIKTGYSEFLDYDPYSRKVSLGDVLRTTCILNLFKDDHVTWVTDKSAFPLLENNPFIDRLLQLDFLTLKQLESEEFDVVINLEKIPGICALCDNIKSWKEYGFRFDTKSGEAKAYDNAFEALAISYDSKSKKENKKTAQELLFEMLGKKWENEEYVLGYLPKTKEEYDVGLNTQIGQKWPTKAWPTENWDKLEELLKSKGIKVTRQDKQGPEIFENLNNYMDWINSCKIIITNDSLGLHLAVALKKKILGLFGSTPHTEVYFYGRGKAILPEPIPGCFPCFKGTCERGKECIEDISVEKVFLEAEKLFFGESKDKKESIQIDTKSLVDNHKLMYHPDRVSKWYENGDCYPIYVEVGTTNLCNHRCVFCALDYLKYGQEFIDTNMLLSTIREMADKGVKSIMFAGEGESVLHKDILLFVKTAKESGMDVSITTNGIPFTKEKIEKILPHLSWIRFSIDSGSPENYALIHGTTSGDFNLLINNLRECVILKKEKNLDVTIGVQFLVIPDNKGEVVKLAKILREIGVDNLQIKPYSHHPNSLNNLIILPEDYNKIEEELSLLESEDFKIIFRKATIERISEGINYFVCYGLPFFALIDARGNIIPCNLFYKNEDFTYGNLYKNSFSEIWEGEKRKRVIQKLKEKGCEDCRKGCRLDVINRYLHRLKYPESHDNFI